MGDIRQGPNDIPVYSAKDLSFQGMLTRLDSQGVKIEQLVTIITGDMNPTAGISVRLSELEEWHTQMNEWRRSTDRRALLNLIVAIVAMFNFAILLVQIAALWYIVSNLNK